jgi:tRNA-Thr(GGU) m(6)t(6)A37 methyltransferase TsaA
MNPVARVLSPRNGLDDNNWGTVVSRIELAEGFCDASFDGIESFSHLEVIFFFDQIPEEQIERRSRHPRGDTTWPKVGIFAQRGSVRPNRIGATIVRLEKREGRVLTVQGLDAVDGTPVLDIKPVMTEFLPRERVRQPGWAGELMRGYWFTNPGH